MRSRRVIVRKVGAKKSPEMNFVEDDDMIVQKAPPRLRWRLRNRSSSVDRTGRAIVLMPGPYDSRGKKVNEVKTHDVFGSHRHFSIDVMVRLLDKQPMYV